MTAPALAFHRVSPRRYDLTGVRTGSVRDQLLRSTLVVHGLHQADLINRDLPLLVLGAGAAGVNAAITAANLGVSASVLEVRPLPFSTLHQAAWRRVDPTEYDWPQPHWQQGHFPIAAGSIALLQHTGTGAALAASWSAEWRRWLRLCNGKGHRGRVSLHPSCNARPFIDGMTESRSMLNVAGPWPDGAGSKSFGAVLSCIGFGRELTYDVRPLQKWGGYSGPAFWTDDDTIRPGGGLPRGISRVIVSGGGDGALQDVQRILTDGYFGRELFERIEIQAQAIRPGLDIAPA